MDVRTLRTVFASALPPANLGSALETVTRGAARLEGILRAFYVFPIFWFCTHLHELRPLLNPRGVELRWPVLWMDWIGVSVAAPFVLGLGFVVASIAAWLPERREVRIAVFVTLLQVLALKFSFGKIHHLMHGWLFATFIFAFFLPNEAFASASASRSQRQASLFVFSAAQISLGLTYSLAGVGKLLGTVYQAV
ncbi:MAG: hypothetical protein AAFN74_11090, partial [Myxococcota bacterium]